MSASQEALIVVCPSCNAANRVPRARLHDHARCGQCKAALFNAQPLELTQANFHQQLGRSDLPWVIDFWAPWCAPCRAMAPVFAAAAGQLEPQVRLAKLDTEAEPQLASRFGIRSIPTLIAFRHGQEVARQAGAMDSTSLIRWIKGVYQMA